jgi:hypothetical protein
VAESDLVLASDAEREAVVERLRAASSEGRMTLEELAKRSEAAYAARTGGELAEATIDLPAERPTATSLQPVRVTRIVSVFANVARTGWWRAEGLVVPISMVGDIELDLRQAAVPAGEVTIRAIAPFGDIEVIVPDGVSVELSGFSLFGRKKVDVRTSASGTPSPVVRVRAFTIFGSVLARS